MKRIVAEPLVSVLLPVRDGADTLVECLQSLRVQTLEAHEVVAVDDGSTDASRALLLAFARQDPRVRVVSNRGRGLVDALNQAAALARAPLIARMDADDVASPLRLELQTARLRRDAALDVLGCRVRLVAAPDLPHAGMDAYVAWLNELLDHDAIVRDLLVESPLAHPSVVLRKELLLSLGGYRDTGGPEDYDLWLRAHAAGARFAKCPEVLLDWRDSPARLSRRDARYARARFQEAKLGALQRGALRDGRAVVLWGAGPIGKGWARALLAAGHTVQAFVEVSPRRLGQRIHGIPVLSVEAGAAHKDALHMAAVGQPGARARIREAAASLGLRDGRELVAVA
jgi:glycosyltransferase involved in cell wall biosynthesis